MSALSRSAGASHQRGARTTGMSVPSQHARASRAASSGPLWLALGRVEARLLARHPATVLGSCLALYWLTWRFWGVLPVLPRDDATVGEAMLLLSGGALLAAHWSTLRSRRHGTEEILATTATVRRDRVIASLFAAIGPAAVAAVIATGWLVAAKLVGGAGVPHAAELLAAPALVALAAVIGTAAATWGPRSITAALVLLVVVGIQGWDDFWGIEAGSDVVPLLTPWMSAHPPFHANVADLRPDEAHLVWLAALAALFGALAVMRVGARRRAASVGAVAVAVAVGAASWHLRPISQAGVERIQSLTMDPSRHQRCSERSRATYCVYPGYEPFVDRYAAAVEPVVARIPGDHPAIRLRQLAYPPTIRGVVADADDPVSARVYGPVRDNGWIEITPAWGLGAAAAPYEFTVALQSAQTALGIPHGVARAPSSDERAGGTCSVARQARGVVALWLAAQSGRGAAGHLRAQLTGVLLGIPAVSSVRGSEDAPPVDAHVARAYLAQEELMFSEVPLDHRATTHFHPLDALYALQLLERPPDEVAAALGTNWDGWKDPSASSDDLARHLGLVVHPSPREALTAANVGERLVTRVERRFNRAESRGTYPSSAERACR